MTSQPEITVEKKKRRRLSNKKTTTEKSEETKSVAKKKRSLKPVSIATSPTLSRSPSPSQPSADLIVNTNLPPKAKRSIRTTNKKGKEKEPADSPVQFADSNSPSKRSILAASEAISKRELERKSPTDADSTPSSPQPILEEEEPVVEEEKKKPITKKRRKLNTKKIAVVPNSDSPTDDIELEGAPVNSYSKYLNPKEAQVNTKVTPITIGVTKRRKILAKKASIPPPQPLSPTINKDITTTDNDIDNNNNYNTQQPEEELDLSQHTIFPNSSYIAHLRSRRNSIDTTSYYSDQSISDDKSSPSSEFFDAVSEFDEQDVLMSSVDPESDSTSEFMDFDMTPSSPLPQQQQLEEPKGFWKSMITFARFTST